MLRLHLRKHRERLLRRRFLYAALIIGGLCFAQAVFAKDMDAYERATIRLLDKVTARVEEREVKVDEAFLYGPLQITIRACRQAPPEDMPESAAFFEITEFKPGSTELSLFKGWMFASNPAVSALEHPVYDVWLTGCKNPLNKAATPAADEASASGNDGEPPRAEDLKKSIPAVKDAGEDKASDSKE